jgi:enoyl-CoA hydratase/carnithine racemase
MMLARRGATLDAEGCAVGYETLELEREGGVLRVWLNRPERLNAIDERVLREVGDLFLSLETDFETRVVVLGGRGRSFCAGADRKPGPPPRPAQEIGERERRWIAQLGRRACSAIADCPAVTIARVQGHAIGGGFCFALACDFRIAARDAVFCLPEVALGLPLTWGSTPRLVHEIGAARARELLMTCREVDAETGAAWGLVHRAVAPEALDDEVARWIEDILDKPELAIYMTKTQLRGYARRSELGDVTETDGDLLTAAARSSAMQARFRMGES